MEGSSQSAFVSKLLAAARAQRTLLCVGLDVDPRLMPAHFSRGPEAVLDFSRAIVDATADLVCAFKPNMAFYEVLGARGIEVLEQTISYVPKHIPVILDAKRGDISSSAQNYARAIFEVLGADACTVNPLLGQDAVEPFIEYRDRGIFLLCRTSNPGGADFQDLSVVDPTAPQGSRPLFETIALKVKQWNRYGNCGLVVGATRPDELKRVRQIAGDLPLLVPGIGAQGGDLAAAVRNGVDARGERAIINSSRQVLYASNGRDFADAARRVARKLVDDINEARFSSAG